MKNKKTMMEYMRERNARQLDPQVPVNPTVYENVNRGSKEPRLSPYAFGSGGKNQSEVGGGVSMRVGKTGSISASGMKGKDEYGGYSNYQVTGSVNIPINRSNKNKKKN